MNCHSVWPVTFSILAEFRIAIILPIFGVEGMNCCICVYNCHASKRKQIGRTSNPLLEFQSSL